MKKLFFSLTVFVLTACGELDQNKPNQAPEIIAVQAPSYIQFSDTVRIRAYDGDGDPVMIGVEAYTNSGGFIPSPFLHFPNDSGTHGDRTAGDLEFTGILKQSFLSGVSTSRFFFYFYVHDGKEETGPVTVIISQNPEFGRPPVISNLIMQDTIQLQPTDVAFSIFLSVSDPDGADDIRSVYFPSAGSGTPISLYDDGDLTAHGDSTAHDGVYSRVLILPPTTPTGVYRFNFRAVDLLDLVSNIITDSIVVIN